MNETYRDLIANAGADAVSHIGLVDSVGTPVGDARKEVTWVAATDGLIRPDNDIIFNMTDGEEVAGWRGYSAVTGGVDYGGAPLTTTTFSNDGTYTLQAASTSIQHNAPS